MTQDSACPSRPDLKSSPEELEALLKLGVPALSLPDQCRQCDEPCEGLNGYGKLEIDMESDMLGTTNQYDRMIVCSSNGKADWIREVTEKSGSLAELVSQAYKTEVKEVDGKSTGRFATMKAKLKRKIGTEEKELVYPSSVSLAPHERIKKLTILNGSNWSSHHESKSSVMIFPDYKVNLIVNHVLSTKEDVSSLTVNYLSHQVNRSSALSSSKSIFESFSIPHRAVLLICSHKTRDKKCHIAAPLLINEFKRALEEEGLGIDEEGDFESDRVLEQIESEDNRAQVFEEGLRKASKRDTVGIYKCSHIGGHRYAGNVIVCLPSGANVWYGRVTPRECEIIVKKTILEGKVLHELLRGGLGLANRASVVEW